MHVLYVSGKEGISEGSTDLTWGRGVISAFLIFFRIFDFFKFEMLGKKRNDLMGRILNTF